LGIDIIERRISSEILNTEQARMERVGVFGTLTISFLAATLMAGLGLLTYSYASLHERLYQFSVLRAVGLQRREIIGQVGLEYLALTAYGALAGVACGILAAYLFVPFFRIGVGAGAPLPPLIPIIAQNQIAPLAIAFSIVIVLLELVIISSAFFSRLFEALRMGHQG
jgi:putative ABC transport system permease protein